MKKFLLILLTLFSLTTFSQNCKYAVGSALGDGAIIRRPVNDLKFLYHYGVMYGGKVVHYNQTGFHLSTLDEFAGNETIKVIQKGLTAQDLSNFNKRIKSVIAKYKGTKYDAINNNCEHFVTELVFGVKKSFQSEGAKQYVKDYWPTVRQNILAKNANSKMYVELLDIYLKKYVR